MLRDGLVLYHGSYTEVQEPDLARCARFKDFGRGFYLTTSLSQARSFARLSLRKARENELVPVGQSRGYVSSFRVTGLAEERLEVLSFPTADVDWLMCVAAHRRRGSFPLLLERLARFDVIAGKVADDQTNNTLVTYLSGGYGPYRSASAMGMCIGLLLPDRLEDQLCFRTPRALSVLVFEGSDAVWA